MLLIYEAVGRVTLHIVHDLMTFSCNKRVSFFKAIIIAKFILSNGRQLINFDAKDIFIPTF